MTNLLSILISGLMLLSGQYTVATRNGATASVPAACVAPTVTNRYTSDYAGNVCTGGCTNGNTVTQLTDMIGTYNLTPNTGTVSYVASAFGSHPAINFSTSALALAVLAQESEAEQTYSL